MMRHTDTLTCAVREKIRATYPLALCFTSGDVYRLATSLRSKYPKVRETGWRATCRCTLQRMRDDGEIIFQTRGVYSRTVKDDFGVRFTSPKSSVEQVPKPNDGYGVESMTLDSKGGRSPATDTGNDGGNGEDRDDATSILVQLDPRDLKVPSYHGHRDPDVNPQRESELAALAKKHGGFNRRMARPVVVNQRKAGGAYQDVDGVGRRHLAMNYTDSETGLPVKTISCELLTEHLTEDEEFALFLAIGKGTRVISQADLFVGLARQGRLPEKMQYEALQSCGFQLPGSGTRGTPHITLPGLKFGWGPSKIGMTKDEKLEPRNANVLKRGLFILKNSTWVKGEIVKGKGGKAKVAKPALLNTHVVAVLAFLKAYQTDFDEGRLRQILDATSPDTMRSDARTWLRNGKYLTHARYVAYRIAFDLVAAYNNGLKKLPRLDADALRFSTSANDVYNAFPKKVVNLH